ncbi:MAG: DUF58 domain-containing protein [Cellvibrionaceae bacterium]|nr:DUF58 domain-containing protein [Cellvibrionaceae bacterium]
MSELSRKRWRPSRKTLAVVLCLGLAALAAPLLGYWWPAFGASWVQTGLTLATGIFALLVLLDFAASRSQPAIRVERQLAGGLALNQWSEVKLTLHHQFRYPITVEIFDGVTSDVIGEQVHQRAPLQPQQTTQVSYRLRALQRGPLTLEHCHLRVPTPLGFGSLSYKVAEASLAKVYPNFAAIAAYTILAAENHTSELGIRQKNRRGQGLDFHQLREYRQGDSLRQISWKASSYRQQLISKEYQDERDQNVILLIDSGRRMRAKDDDLDHFDHALNASILVSYIALRQGDSVGVMSFGNSERWISPQKGADRVRVILNGLYDLQVGNRAPDYLAAAEKLSQLQRKRSLVVIVTNSRDEEIDELVMAVKLLQKRHLVLVANIREAVLDQTLHEPIQTLDQAATYAGTVTYLQQRAAAHRKLQQGGTYAVDCLAKELAPALANSYWEIKRAGVL